MKKGLQTENLMIPLRKCFLLIGLSLFSSFCHAQNDSILKTDTNHLKSTVFKSNFLNSGIDLSDRNYTPYNHKLYNPDFYRLRNSLDPFFISWPFDYLPDYSYKQYSLKNNFYNKYDPLNTFIYLPYQTNPLYDPTNPAGAGSAGEALILGSLNYLLFKVFSGE